MFRYVAVFFFLFCLECVCVHGQMMPPKVVEVVKVTRADLTQTVRLFGTVRAKREVTLLAEADGVLDTAWVAGRKVTKGEVFATLENPEAKKGYELAQSAEKIALEQYNRSQALLKNSAVSQKAAELDRAHWIEATQATLRAKLDFEKHQFKAPFDGVLGIFKVREGAYVQRADPIVTLYDPSDLVLEFEIPAKFLKAQTRKAVIGGRTYTDVQTQGVVESQTNTAPAFVDLKECPDCFVGTVMDVYLVVKESPKALFVPSQSLFMESGDQFVYVVGGGKTSKRKVAIGIENGQKVEVLSGLKEGETLVSVNPGRLTDAADVRVAAS